MEKCNQSNGRFLSIFLSLSKKKLIHTCIADIGHRTRHAFFEYIDNRQWQMPRHRNRCWPSSWQLEILLQRPSDVTWHGVMINKQIVTVPSPTSSGRQVSPNRKPDESALTSTCDTVRCTGYAAVCWNTRPGRRYVWTPHPSTTCWEVKKREHSPMPFSSTPRRTNGILRASTISHVNQLVYR
jgi:hypothetical protein